MTALWIEIKNRSVEFFQSNPQLRIRSVRVPVQFAIFTERPHRHGFSKIAFDKHSELTWSRLSEIGVQILWDSVLRADPQFQFSSSTTEADCLSTSINASVSLGSVAHDVAMRSIT